MSSAGDALSIAVQYHQAGRLDAAEQIYLQILASDPNHSDALHLLGVVASQRGQYQAGIELIGRAIELNSFEPGFHINLGNALSALGKASEAAAAYERAIALAPNLAEAHCSLGNALASAGRVDEAVDSYRRALALKPSLAQAHSNLGAALKSQGKLDEAVVCYELAVEWMPDLAEAHTNLANALRDRGKLQEAVMSYRRALALKPDSAAVLNNLGHVLLEQGQREEAIACCRRAVELKPDYAEAYSNLGAAYRAQMMLDEAIASYLRALDLSPNFVEAHNNLGNALHLQNKFDEAAAGYRRALELKPDYAEAHFSQSFVMLQRGDFQRGWDEHEWRWKTRETPPRGFSQPQWQGESLPAGTIILIHTEQGLGDAIHFVRYAKLVKEANPTATVVFECDRPLVKLLGSFRGIDRLVVHGETLPQFDAYVPLVSLPRLVGTRIETIGQLVPYLIADDNLVVDWGQRLKTISGFRIGINWHGRENHPIAQRRDLPLGEFAKLTALPNVRLVSLQKEAGQSDLAASGGQLPIVDFGPDLDTASGPFMDTAAIMMNIDLVITSDTSVAHLAGALGAPVWVVLPFAADWRWFLDRSDSPWYPTMRLFRQTDPGDWASVFEEIKTALAARLQE